MKEMDEERTRNINTPTQIGRTTRSSVNTPKTCNGIGYGSTSQQFLRQRKVVEAGTGGIGSYWETIEDKQDNDKLREQEAEEAKVAELQKDGQEEWRHGIQQRGINNDMWWRGEIGEEKSNRGRTFGAGNMGTNGKRSKQQGINKSISNTEGQDQKATRSTQEQGKSRF